MEKVSKAKHFDLESVEAVLRSAVLVAGAELLTKLLNGIGRGRRENKLICTCGTTMESKGVQQKTVLTILGPVEFKRSRYDCPDCKASRYPGDEELDIVGTSRSPGVRRMMARAGSRQTFKESMDDLRIYAGIKVSAKDVERVSEKIGMEMEVWQGKERQELLSDVPSLDIPQDIPVMYIEMDGTGVPMVKREVAGRKGKQPDGTAHTREAKLGCVFTQTTTDDEGMALRDEDSTSFVGAIETAEEFGGRIEAEAIRRGLYSAQKVVVLGDGAAWIRGLTELRLPQAMQIVDLYHAKEHVAELAKLLSGSDKNKLIQYRTRWWDDLDNGNVEKIINEGKEELQLNDEVRKGVESQIHYLQENKDRMRYDSYRKQGIFVGSGVIEAGCKSVIGQRLKQSGMEWSVRGANAIIALRCTSLSGRLEDFWESRVA